MNINCSFFYGIIFLTLIFSCKNNKPSEDLPSSKANPTKITTIEDYVNKYNDEGLLVSSTIKTTISYLSTGGEMLDYLEDQELVYYYDNNKLSRIETYNSDDETPSGINLFHNFSEEKYRFSGLDTITYSKELRNQQGDFLIRESKVFPVENENLIPSHLLLRTTYDNENRMKTFEESDLLNRTSTEIYYEYRVENDTLIGIAFNENRILEHIIKSTTKGNVTTENTYDPYNYLIHSKDTHKEGEQTILIVEKDYLEHIADSLFYDNKGREVKYVSVSDYMYTKTMKEYDNKGSIVKIERTMIQK